MRPAPRPLSVIGLLVGLIAALHAPSVSGEEQPPQPAAEQGAAEEAAENAAPDLGLPEPQPGQVPPLGAWVRPEKSEVELPKVETPERPYFFLEELDEETVEEVDNTELLETKRSNFVMLSTRERRRLDRAIEKQRQRVLRARLREREEYWRDPRGEPELRICSVNTGGYGLRGEVRKLIRGARGATKALRRRERSLVSAIGAADCDVVALQSLIGRDIATVKEALDRLIGRLKKQNSERSWDYLVGDSNSRFSRNGFVFDKGRAELERFESYTATLLPRFEIFERKKFAQGPLEIELVVKGKEDPQPRRIILLTMNLQERIAANKPEPAADRMQMAEGVKQLGLIHQLRLNPLDPPMLFLLGDLQGDMRDPANFILQGRRELPDFRKDGGCEIVDGNRFSCSKKLLKPAVFLPLLRESWHPDFTLRKKTGDDGEETYVKVFQLSPRERIQRKNEMILRTSGIYAVQPDIKHVLKAPWEPGELNVGTVSVANGLRSSPLVWAELNW